MLHLFVAQTETNGSDPAEERSNRTYELKRSPEVAVNQAIENGWYKQRNEGNHLVWLSLALRKLPGGREGNGEEKVMLTI